MYSGGYKFETFKFFFKNRFFFKIRFFKLDTADTAVADYLHILWRYLKT